MKIPVLPAVALLSLLALHSAQGASLGSSEEESGIENYAAGSEAFNNQFLNIDKLKSALKPEEFLNWHALFEVTSAQVPADSFLLCDVGMTVPSSKGTCKDQSIKKKLPFLNWDAFPKLKGLRSATPDAQ